MDPVTAMVTALALGASAALKETATSAVKDAYAGLKRLVIERYARSSVEALEEKPESKARREAVREDLEAKGAAADAEVVASMKELLRALTRHDPEAGSVIGVDVRDVEAESLRIEAVRSAGDGVRVEGARVARAIHIGGVEAGSTGRIKKKTDAPA